MSNVDQVKTASGINVLAGIWLVISPFLLGFSGTAASTNAIITGIIIGLIALVRSSSPDSAVWLDYVNVILGVWLVISSFVLGSMVMAAVWNSIILGVVVVVLAGWDSSAASKLRMT